ncbi:chloride channel protein [Brunnivagina elsteri]|uniref:Chloride channel protein n=1 Tax=Brunnivagina elsteri CCALA 953 TaxID=987040 RepID=A0A2A2TM37_9CYAN|nr:chloride channel protein [Calothrix elsteri]PAX58469.1 chloride channel protein [Calothrix elsteri CCALA 953]
MPSPVLPYRFRNLWQPRRGLAIAEASVIGLVAALSAVLLKFGSGALGTWRVRTSHLFPAWIVLPLVGVGFGFVAGWLVERLAPEASGSGIPQVKASLANVPIKLSWRVAFVKLLSAIIAIGSGLTLGRQGPTVQVGAGLAAGMSRLVPTSPDHRRQMIAAGAGAGLAAAFNAPIAGVLFIIEELLQDLSGLTLGTAIIASFIGGVVSRLLGGGSLLLNLPETKLSSSFLITEIPFYLLLGVCAGLFAALFNLGLIYSIKLYRRLHVRLPIRIALAGLTSGIIVALLPESFRDNTGLREFVIATSGNASLAAIAFISQFFLTLVAFGSGAPGGLFAPSLILGSCLGHIIGIFQEYLLHAGSPTTYALAGMGAFFSGVSKVPITAIVIVFEMTTDFNLVLPLMIGSVTSYLVADKLVPGSLYDKLLKLNGINIQNQGSPDGILTKLTAREVMQCRVESFDADMSVEEAMQAFSRSHHRGFPVVDEGRLVGIITQSDLLKVGDSSSEELDKSAIIKQMVLRELMTPEPVTVSPHHSLSNVLYLLDRYKISRLPVLEGKRLIGIITRGDIIRAEADRLNCQNPEKPPTEPSYLVYQTRSPSTGRGRLLLPIANPDTAATLIQMAVAIAKERHYEIECVQIMLVPRYSSPAETQVRTAKSRRLLRQAEVLGKKWKIPIHTQIRVAHDVAQAILETINERHINIMLMGWKGNTDTPGRIFGNVVDTVVRQATCEVMLVKLGTYHSSQPNPPFNNWLIPMAGGPNAWLAIKLLPALVTLGEYPKIHLTRVFHPNETKPDMTVLEDAIRQIIRRRQLYTTVIAEAIKAESVSEGVIDLVNKEHYDVVVLGASREGMLQQAIKGNIPEAIASGVESTVILVRGAINPE